jgi:type I restriction enzyme S subunit
MVALGDVCEVVGGGTPKTSRVDYWGGDVLWATPKDLSEQRSRHMRRTGRSITEAGLKSCGAQVLRPRSVLLSSRAPIGLVAVNAVAMATNQGFKSLVPNAARVDADFLAHWLAGHTAYLQSLGTGATFREISKSVVVKIEIPLPPLDEQRRIARVLDAADRLKATRRAALTRFDALASAHFISGSPGIDVGGRVRLGGRL